MNQLWHLHHSLDQTLHTAAITLLTIFLSFGLLLTAAILTDQSGANIKQALNNLEVRQAAKTAA